MTEHHHDEITAITRFAYEAGHLKVLLRAGWALPGVSNPESVAGHSFRVAVLAFVIAAAEGGNPERAACLGLFHDFPETRQTDIASVNRPYLTAVPAQAVIADQVAGLPAALAAHITGLVAEHEEAKSPDATLEARCSRDADKIDCLMQARVYQAAGNTLVQPWIDTMVPAVTTRTGIDLAKAAQEVSPGIWWEQFAASYGTLPES